MSSSANQPVWVGISPSSTARRTQRNPRPAEASRYLTVPPVTKSAPSVSDVDLDRAGGLVAVGEDQSAVGVCGLGDRRDVVAVTSPIGDRRAADERRALVDRLGELLRRDRAVGLGAHVDDFGSAQLLRVGDLADRRELVVADHDPRPAAALERHRRDDRVHPLRDRRRHSDLVGLTVEQLGEPGACRLCALDPELPLGAVRVPACQVLLVGGANPMRESTLRARVEIRRVLEDRELGADGLAHARRRRLRPVCGDSALTPARST